MLKEQKDSLQVAWAMEGTCSKNGRLGWGPQSVMAGTTTEEQGPEPMVLDTP